MEEKFHEEFYRAPPDVTLAELPRIIQMLNETVEKYIGRFRKLRNLCKTYICEVDYVPLVVKGL
ncbi:conserved hypothetical protein [Ricinus communis]|uniref:Retrotransposon gag domain-containing protein n=1 Tax=Ricinus communis TaxID=3988 RepID=B9RJ02_RICCO|nr:conserved hypothetical protein [Ricinus communis]